MNFKQDGRSRDRPGALLCVCALSSYLQRAVVIAMGAMIMVQVTANEVIHMVAVGNPFVTARGTVGVLTVVSFAVVCGCAGVRVFAAYRNRVLIDVFAVNVMHMAVMQIVGMVVVYYSLMPALRIVHVVMRGMFLAFRAH